MNTPDTRVSRSPGQWIVLAAVALVVVAAVLITIRFSNRDSAGMPRTGPEVMAALRAFRPVGWQVTEQPLGPNEFSQQLVGQILRFDDAAFLHFQSGNRDFAVYVAYWEPGKADMRTVNAHTPDTCWVNSGWQTKERRSGFDGFGVGASLAAGEYRCYTNEGTTQYVAFWHLLAGRPVKMWRNGFPTLDFMWTLFQGDRKALGGEQYFIRISSTQALENFWSDPVFTGVLQCLAKAGLVTDVAALH